MKNDWFRRQLSAVALSGAAVVFCYAIKATEINIINCWYKCCFAIALYALSKIIRGDK